MHVAIFGAYPVENINRVKAPTGPDFRADLRRMQRFYGIYSTVARQFGVSPQAVRQVALGTTHSRRLLAAIEAEYRRVEAETRGAA